MPETHAAILAPVAFALGLFYALGGLFHMRSLVLDRMVDTVLLALGDDEARNEARRTHLLSAGAALTFASGLALMALSRWAPALFAGNLILQGALLVWAARAVPPRDEPEREGLRAMRRAFLVYLAAFGFVLFLDRAGVWHVWIEPAFVELAVVALPTLAVSWFFRRESEPAGVPPASPLSAPRTPPAEMPRPDRLRLAPEYRCSPLWDDGRGNMVAPASLGLSGRLVDRILAWDAAFQAARREDDAPGLFFPDVAAERAWVKEGEAIAAALAREWPGPLNVQISALDMLVRDARHDLSPWSPTPGHRAAWIGERCGVAEIEAAIARLDVLARKGCPAGLGRRQPGRHRKDAGAVQAHPRPCSRALRRGCRRRPFQPGMGHAHVCRGGAGRA